ncbi:MAG: 3'-5' exonuclease [Arenicellales bacterium]
MNILAFDIETIPDVAGGRRLYDLHDLDDGEVAEIMFAKRRQQTDSDFLPVHLQRIAAISAVLRTGEQCKVWSLGSPESTEAELIERFFDGIQRYTPTLVTWNGGGFDLPVLHHRALIHGIPAGRYWDSGENDREFKWNNYLNRFHSRHTDIMDVLSGYQPRAFAPLDQVAVLCGLPGKMGMDGSKVWDAWRDGRIEEIRNYCETDALNTYLLYLRWLLMRSDLDEERYRHECQRVRDSLSAEDRPHLKEFLAAWR